MKQGSGGRRQGTGVRGQGTTGTGLSTLVSRLSTINHQPSTLNAARGFTLLEVIVALGLSVILLAAVYGAINLSYKLSSAGREQMEQAQLVRELFRRMEADIRSVVFRLQEEVAIDSEEAAEEDEEEVVVEEMTNEEALTNGSSGVYGDPQSLVLHISRPSRVVGFEGPGSAEDPGVSGSDLAAVNYFLAVQGASGLPGAVARMAHEGSLLNTPRAGTVTGLTRLEGDLMSIKLADETGNIDTLAANARILADEVVSVSFAYWDGLEWWESWDSIANGALPAAIEITLGIDTSEKDADGVGTRSLADRIRTTSTVNDAEPTFFRHVVALPLAEPFAGELSQ